jgi:MFS family permease
MSGEADDRPWWTHYERGLGISTRNNTIAYGYSVGATATFAVLDEFHHGDVARIFLFIVGAAVPFAVVNAIITRGYSREFADEPGVVVALATSFSLVSVGAAVGVATLIAWGLPSWVAWVCAPLAFTSVYLLAVGAETAIAAERHEAGGSQ